MEEKIKDDFLPSSRSIAFRKTAWEEVGGYPEWLNTCEDLFFAKILKNKGFKFFVEKKAIVFWPQRKNLCEATRQFFDYAYGDGRAKYIRVNTVFLFARYFFGLSILFLTLITGSIFGVAFLVILIILYLFWAISKNYKYVRKTEAIFWLPILQIASDISVISGMLLGLSSLIWVTKKMQ